MPENKEQTSLLNISEVIDFEKSDGSKEVISKILNNHNEENASLFFSYCDYILKEKPELALIVYSNMLNLTANSSESIQSLVKSSLFDFLKTNLDIIELFEDESEKISIFKNFLLARTGNKFTSYKNKTKAISLLEQFNNEYWNDYENVLVLIHLNSSISEKIVDIFFEKSSLSNSKDKILDFMERLPSKFLQEEALLKLPQSLKQDKDFLISAFQNIDYHSEDIPKNLLDDVIFVINIAKSAKNNRILLEHFQDIDSKLHKKRVVDIIQCFQEMSYINSKLSSKPTLADLEDNDIVIAQKYLVTDNNNRFLNLDSSKLFFSDILKMYTSNLFRNPFVNDERNLSIWELLHKDKNVPIRDITQFYLDCKMYKHFNKSNIHEQSFEFIKLLTKTNILAKSDNDECYFHTFELATEQFKVFIQKTLAQKLSPIHEAITIVNYFDGSNLLTMAQPKLTQDEFVEFMLQIPHEIIEKIIDNSLISRYFLATIGDNYLQPIDSDIFLQNLKTLSFDKKLMLDNSVNNENTRTIKARKF